MNLKNAKWVAALALAALPWFSAFSQTQAPPLSPAASDVVKLVQSGTTDQVILGYIQNSQAPYNLSADTVLYLKDLGVSSPVITAMLNHDKSATAPTYNYNQQLYPPNGATPPPPGPDQPVGPPPSYVPTRAPVPEPAPTDVSTTPPPEVNYFYNDLSPYGSWVDLDGYGWCWQPSVVAVNPGWRPYCDSGHWVYSDAGWFWASDYSWGWAPFHYGRWVLHPRSGWVWFPDTTWGPAWVVWRNGGDSCGWAPLPRGAVFVSDGLRFNGVAVAAGFDFGLGVGVFTFVGVHDFASHDFVHVRYSPAECDRVFHQTTIIHDYSVDSHHMVVNHGIPVDRVAAATHTQIHAVAIHDLPAGSSKPAAHGGADTGVYRHELSAQPHPVVHPVAQKVNNNNPEIRHGPATLSNPSHPSTTGNKAPPTYTPTHTQPQNQYTPQPTHNQNGNSSGTYQSSGSPTTSHPTETTHTSTTTPSTSTSHSTSAAPSQPNSHTYYPKGYYQAQSLHMLPPQNANGVLVHSSPPASSTGSSSSGGNSNSRGQTSPGQSQGQSKQPPK